VTVLAPFSLHDWIARHRHLLQPPVGNKCIVDGDFIVMVVGGPNARSDFHSEDGPELFYQIEGTMTLRVQEHGQVRDIPISAGEMLYLPPQVPHSPQRTPGSVGLVVERKRLSHEQDHLSWYCPHCNHLLYSESFHLQDIERDLPPVFARFHGSLAARTCASCGNVHPVPPAG
jgi:3-hydroxyanthranilate 3,4-dioxygenase